MAYRMSGLHRTGANEKEVVWMSSSFYSFLDKPEGEEKIIRKSKHIQFIKILIEYRFTEISALFLVIKSFIGFRDMHMQRKICTHCTYTKVLRQKH